MGHAVWTTGSRNSHVHARPDCDGLKRGQSGKPALQVVEADLAEIYHPVLCRWCWPDSPRPRVWHPRCAICRQSRPLPCPHNGAVLVHQPRRGQWLGRFGDSEYDPDLVVYVRRWVWPENAWKYTLVDAAA